MALLTLAYSLGYVYTSSIFFSFRASGCLSQLWQGTGSLIKLTLHQMLLDLEHRKPAQAQGEPSLEPILKANITSLVLCSVMRILMFKIISIRFDDNNMGSFSTGEQKHNIRLHNSSVWCSWLKLELFPEWSLQIIENLFLKLICRTLWKNSWFADFLSLKCIYV